jgi:hypothetical protein
VFHFRRLSGKIRSGTSEETKKTQLSLFEAIKVACSEVSGGTMVEDGTDDSQNTSDDDGGQDNTGCFAFTQLFSELFRKHRNDVVAKKARAATVKLQKFATAWDSLEVSDNIIESELTDIHASLDKILNQVNTYTSH